MISHPRFALDATHSPAIREAWYVGCLSRLVRPGRTVARTILGQPVLIGRTASGEPFALLDICPHRGLPLHFGRFDGVEVECRYHGWRFDPAGRCTAMPGIVDRALPDLSKFSVRRFPVQERYGAIWVYPGSRPETAPSLPDLPPPADGAPKLALTVTFQGDIDHAVIGLMDPSHGAYVHRSWYWRRQAIEKEKRFAPSPWGFTMLRHAPSANTRAYRILGSGRSTEISFRLPGIRTELIEAGGHRMCNLTALTPVDGATTELTQIAFWTNPLLTLIRPLLRRFAFTFIGQDRDIVAMQQEGLKHHPSLLLVGDPDAQARWYFRLKAEYHRSLEEGRPFVNPVKERVLQWRS